MISKRMIKFVNIIVIILFLNSIIPRSTCLRNDINNNNAELTKSFTIDYHNNTFLKDGQPFRYISGSFHYMRSLRDHWEDIFEKFRLAGLNAVQTYVEWSSHQPYPEETYNFDGNLNIFEYFELAQKHDLLVILRIGPYIDAERDMGGLPPWLLWQKENMGQRLRTSDLEFNYFVSRWFDFLLPKLITYLYKNGGPIIMIQVENEYGSFGCDKNYTSFLRDLIRMQLGEDVVLFTTDGNGASYLNCGVIHDVYPTIDFGPSTFASTNSSFEVQRQFAPNGPLVNSEYYSGWLDHWGQPHSKSSASNVGDGLDYILSLGANVNIYMFYGGTSFGFKSGSNIDSSRFDACPTSYDYDAPLTESRDPTPKYFAIKRIISKYIPVPDPNPPVSAKGFYGRIDLQPFSFLIGSSLLKDFIDSNPVLSLNPLSFEELKVDSGFILYETTVKFLPRDPAVLLVKNLKDRAYIYVNRTFVGIVSRNQNPMSIPLLIDKGSKLSILVENQGRPCYGSSLGESKGLGDNVYLYGQLVQHWKMYRLSESNLNPGKLAKYAMKFLTSSSSRTKLKTSSNGSGSFFFGVFTLPINSSQKVLDTFIDFDGWRKGIVAVNELILGRYWPVMGPQKTLYLPASVLKPYPQKNTIIMFELENAPSECLQPAQPEHSNEGSGCHVTLTNHHQIDAETPDKETRRLFTKAREINLLNNNDI